MWSVDIKNACSCLLKSGLPEHQEFEDEKSARDEATVLLGQMQREFCKRHAFTQVETTRAITIFIRPAKV